MPKPLASRGQRGRLPSGRAGDVIGGSLQALAACGYGPGRFNQRANPIYRHDFMDEKRCPHQLDRSRYIAGSPARRINRMEAEHTTHVPLKTRHSREGRVDKKKLRPRNATASGLTGDSSGNHTAGLPHPARNGLQSSAKHAQNNRTDKQLVTLPRPHAAPAGCQAAFLRATRRRRRDLTFDRRSSIISVVDESPRCPDILIQAVQYRCCDQSRASSRDWAFQGVLWWVPTIVKR